MIARPARPGRTGSLWIVLAALLVALFHATPARAHEIRPALLQITESRPGWFDVMWKVPMRGDMILSIAPVLPPSLKPVAPPSDQLVPGARIQRTTCTGDAGALVGETIFIEGLSALQIDVLLRIDLADGTSHSAILRPGSPSFEVPARAGKREVAWSYMRMGVIHILEGIDHLLFLVGLMLLVTGFWRLLKTITAFTVAHSITLGLATLGLVNVPSAPTEAIIALSIVFVAVEVVRKRRGQIGFTERNPWIVAFVFGLFHGLGFAGALSEVGVPQHEVPLALLMFNVGVEIGQVAFVTVVATVLAVLQQIKLPALRKPELGYVAVMAPVYVIGGLAAFWTIQRVLSFLPLSA
jgi:hydrogenase/urease accessory protein HupE